MRSRARQILDKSLDAIIASIEIYNKPSFAYREEAFSILCINAWELLLKARILLVDGNRISAIIKYERRPKQNGELSTKLYRSRNRSGNHVTIGLFMAYDRLVNTYGDTLDPLVRMNLEALTEIRDNAVHFFNKEFDLTKKIHEIGTACLKNYLNLVRQWFGVDLGQYRMFLMPIAFLRNVGSVQGHHLNNEERNLLEYVKSLEEKADDDTSRDFNLSLDLDIRMKRVAGDGATVVRVSNDPDALPVVLEEESILERYPWDYRILTTRLRRRYTDFVENQRYHQLRRQCETDLQYCKLRVLDPGNSKSPKKKFYNPNIVREFDKQYTRPSRESTPSD